MDIVNETLNCLHLQRHKCNEEEGEQNGQISANDHSAIPIGSMRRLLPDFTTSELVRHLLPLNE